MLRPGATNGPAPTPKRRDGAVSRPGGRAIGPRGLPSIQRVDWLLGVEVVPESHQPASGNHAHTSRRLMVATWLNVTP